MSVVIPELVTPELRELASLTLGRLNEKVDPSVDDLRRLEAARHVELQVMAQHPGLFLQHVSMVDEREAEEFRFRFAPEQIEVWERGEIRPIRGDSRGLWLGDQILDPAYYKSKGLTGWEWQGDLLDFWELNHRTLDLKARQIGVTWLRGGRGLWRCLFRPGSNFLIYRQKEDDAVKIVKRVWAMLHSVDEWMWNGAEVVTPSSRAVEPSTVIAVTFPNGRKSTIQGMSSSAAAGHGETAAEALADEFAHVQTDLAPKIIKAAGPAVGKSGFFGAVSTANGRSDDEGNGNYMHFLWSNAATMGYAAVFHPWWMHPDRDQHWYDNDPEVRGLRWFERAEQYPSNPHEAFTLTNQVFFDRDSLAWYAKEGVREPLYRANFVPHRDADGNIVPAQAVFKKADDGNIAVYEKRVEGRSYGIGADVASGRGSDYSAAYVIDLTSMALVAEFHAKLDADLYAYQLHFLGKLYNTARIAVEMGGGWGDPVIISLHDGKEGRPPYPKLFRYREDSRVDMPERKGYGFPMTSKSRPLVVNQMEKAIRERSIPYLSHGLLFECENFVAHETGTTPRAALGLNDDRVMAAAIALELYRRYGTHPERPKRKPRKPYKHWLQLGNEDRRPTRPYPWQH